MNQKPGVLIEGSLTGVPTAEFTAFLLTDIAVKAPRIEGQSVDPAASRRPVSPTLGEF